MELPKLVVVGRWPIQRRNFCAHQPEDRPSFDRVMSQGDRVLDHHVARRLMTTFRSQQPPGIISDRRWFPNAARRWPQPCRGPRINAALRGPSVSVTSSSYPSAGATSSHPAMISMEIHVGIVATISRDILYHRLSWASSRTCPRNLLYKKASTASSRVKKELTVRAFIRGARFCC